MPFYQKSVEQIYEEFSSGQGGITAHDAHQRLARYGANEIIIKGESLWKKLIEPFASIFMLVLFVAVIISLAHGAYVDAVIVLAIMLASAIIDYIQKFSTERILKSLQKKSVQNIDVIRNRETISINASQLVPGDVVMLTEGDKVPADIRLTRASNVRVDESMLTGESEAIAKNIETLHTDKPVYEQSNMLFSGSFIISGQATGVVVLTGNATEFGRIASLTGTASGTQSSPVQQKIDKLITKIIIAVGAMAVVAFFLALSRGIEFTEALRFVIALSVSAVPEGLPVAISVIVAIGMKRMATKKALVRNMRAIETVGVITTIATDKTGTLTENRLSVQETWQPSWSDEHLASFVKRTVNHDPERKTHDPLDVAIHAYVQAEDVVQLPGDVVAVLPFDQTVAMSGNVWRHNGKNQLVIKGAPERIIEQSRLTKDQKVEVERALQALTGQGYRVIAIASTSLQTPIQAFRELHSSVRFDFLGFVAVADTLRPAARKAIVTARNAGVTVRMITGDHFETAYNIGKKLGLVESRTQVYDCRTMDSMSNDELVQQLKDIRVFSRVTPENKYRILEILKLNEITAMTGDGVNDVPALTNAHIGIAMGSGSQIAKDAGDIVLLNDNFASIVTAMREGRIVFANIKRMLFYLLSTNIGEVIVSLGALFVGLPMPLMPVQILWVNLVTDTAMVIPLGLEPGERDVMRRKPLKANAPLFTPYMLSRIILIALIMGAYVLGVFALYNGWFGADYGRTIAFSSLIVIQWASAITIRSTYESAISRMRIWSTPFYIGLTIAVVAQYFAFFGPLQSALHVTSVAIGDLVITGAIGFLLMFVLVELHKLIGRRILKIRGEA